MGKALRQAVGTIAVYALILQAVLTAFAAPPALAALSDPLAIICHGSGDAGGSPPQQPLSALTCDHCILCNVTAATAAPDVTSPLILPPHLATRISGAPSDPALPSLTLSTARARAPPQRA